MALEVLRRQEFFVERCGVQQKSYHRRRNCPANVIGNRKQRRKGSPKPDKRKIKAAWEAEKANHGGVRDTRRIDGTNGGIVMGQVRLLRRGESLSSVAPKIAASAPVAPVREPVDGLPVYGMKKAEPDSPEIVPKQVRRISAPPADFYAGSAWFLSPSPKALPLPSFSTRISQKTRFRFNSGEN